MFCAVVFLCGRPGCGRESSATLQIDAPSSTISLVDPRVSRDGVPLCPHHADSTTPPLGWSMNDLRSRNRTLAPVRTLGPRTGEIVSAPPGASGGAKRKGKKPNPLFQASRTEAEAEIGPAPTAAEADPLSFQVSRDLKSMAVTALPDRDVDADPDDRPDPATGPDVRPIDDDEDNGPPSRPSRRREVVDEDDVEDDKFPWHHQFDDDEPQELQAKSPLLSRAFRSSVG